MKNIDFSSMHDILIRHADGTLTPMDEPYYEAIEIANNTWMIMSSGDYHYLLVGDDMGVAIDTGYGAGNLREYLEKLCGKPVPWVINTHSHFDHTANNCYFDNAYMAEEALELASVPYPSFEGIEFPRDYPKTVVGDHDIIPLKGRNLEIFRIGDHSADSIAILDRKERILFTGDEFMDGKSLNKSVEKWKNDLEKLVVHKDEYDLVYGGAAKLNKDIVETFYEAACKIMNGEPSEEPIEEKTHHHKEEEQTDQIIYDWRMPRPQDRPKGGPVRINENRVKFYYKGYCFTYDKTKMYEDKVSQ